MFFPGFFANEKNCGHAFDTLESSVAKIVMNETIVPKLYTGKNRERDRNIDPEDEAKGFSTVLCF